MMVQIMALENENNEEKKALISPTRFIILT